MSADRFLSRWSRLKRAQPGAEPVHPPAVPSAPTTAADPASLRADAPEAAAPLPDPATLSLESDFTAFLKEEVGEAVRRQALRKLFNDPHFNVMDGLDIYIDDYSVSKPIPPELLAKLKSAAEWLAKDETDESAAADVPPGPGEPRREASPAADAVPAPLPSPSATPPAAADADTVPSIAAPDAPDPRNPSAAERN